jgi:hypothetical protein
MRSIPRVVRSWLLLVGAFAVGLKAADRVPALMAGTPHGARIYATVAEAEHAVGAKIWVPAYYPDTMAWPPARIDLWPGPPTSVALRILGRADGRERLVLVQSLHAPASPPDELLPAVHVLTTNAVTVGRHPATLTRVLAPSGQLLHDVWWDQGPRRLTLRYSGPVEELILIATSLERMHR